MMAGRAEPFRIAVPDGAIADMRRRIRDTRWAEDFGNADWCYGVEGGWLRDMAAYWADAYDWRAQEARMNAFPGFRAVIEDVPVHFLHVEGKGPNPVPLILTHGWPWSFWDYRDVIGPLTDPAAHGAPHAPSFSLVIPSLPGFGFSSPLRKAVGVADIVRLWATLMTEILGYPRFMASGGDWGAVVTSHLGHFRPDVVAGVHIMFPHVPGIHPTGYTDADFAPDEQWMLTVNADAPRKIDSHIATHSRDPQTLAYALADSPVGCAAWLWERRRAWSDCDGDVLSVFSRDDLCTLASLYWLTGSIGTSMRLYWKHWAIGAQVPLLHRDGPVIPVPTGYAIFPRDNFQMPRRVIEERTNLKHYTLMPRGGHFGVAEQPDLVVGDLRAFAAHCR